MPTFFAKMVKAAVMLSPISRQACSMLFFVSSSKRKLIITCPMASAPFRNNYIIPFVKQIAIFFFTSGREILAITPDTAKKPPLRGGFSASRIQVFSRWERSGSPIRRLHSTASRPATSTARSST